MITPISDMPDGALGFEASGRVTIEDQERILEPTVQAALAKRSKLRLLYKTSDGFEGYAHGMILDNVVFGSRHFADFDRIAFVSDHGPYDKAVRHLDGLMPTQIRVFGREEIGAAKAWLAQ